MQQSRSLTAVRPFPKTGWCGLSRRRRGRPATGLLAGQRRAADARDTFTSQAPLLTRSAPPPVAGLAVPGIPRCAGRPSALARAAAARTAASTEAARSSPASPASSAAAVAAARVARSRPAADPAPRPGTSTSPRSPIIRSRMAASRATPAPLRGRCAPLDPAIRPRPWAATGGQGRDSAACPGSARKPHLKTIAITGQSR